MAVARAQKEPPGYATWIADGFVDGVMAGYYAVENYRTSNFPAMAGYDSDAFRRHLGRSEGCCPGCPTDCVKEFSVPESGLDPRSGGLRQEAGGVLGPNLGSRDLRTIIRANSLCHLLGLDITSLGFCLSFVMECRAQGVLDPAGLAVGPTDL